MRSFAVETANGKTRRVSASVFPRIGRERNHPSRDLAEDPEIAGRRRGPSAASISRTWRRAESCTSSQAELKVLLVARAPGGVRVAVECVRGIPRRGAGGERRRDVARWSRGKNAAVGARTQAHAITRDDIARRVRLGARAPRELGRVSVDGADENRLEATGARSGREGRPRTGDFGCLRRRLRALRGDSLLRGARARRRRSVRRHQPSSRRRGSTCPARGARPVRPNRRLLPGDRRCPPRRWGTRERGPESRRARRRCRSPYSRCRRHRRPRTS